MIYIILLNDLHYYDLFLLNNSYFQFYYDYIILIIINYLIYINERHLNTHMYGMCKWKDIKWSFLYQLNRSFLHQWGLVRREVKRKTNNYLNGLYFLHTWKSIFSVLKGHHEPRYVLFLSILLWKSFSSKSWIFKIMQIKKLNLHILYIYIYTHMEYQSTC